jgi:hypothetical protein
MAVPTELGQLEAYSVRRRTSGKLDGLQTEARCFVQFTFDKACFGQSTGNRSERTKPGPYVTGHAIYAVGAWRP